MRQRRAVSARTRGSGLRGQSASSIHLRWVSHRRASRRRALHGRGPTAPTRCGEQRIHAGSSARRAGNSRWDAAIVAFVLVAPPRHLPARIKGKEQRVSRSGRQSEGDLTSSTSTRSAPSPSPSTRRRCRRRGSPPARREPLFPTPSRVSGATKNGSRPLGRPRLSESARPYDGTTGGEPQRRQLRKRQTAGRRVRHGRPPHASAFAINTPLRRQRRSSANAGRP